jgi:hypothetical protein
MRNEFEARLTNRLAEAGLERHDKTVETVVKIVLGVFAGIFKNKLQEIDAILKEDAGADDTRDTEQSRSSD